MHKRKYVPSYSMESPINVNAFFKQTFVRIKMGYTGQYFQYPGLRGEKRPFFFSFFKLASHQSPGQESPTCGIVSSYTRIAGKKLHT